MNTIRGEWNDAGHCVRITFVDSEGKDVGFADYFDDADLRGMHLDIANWIGNNMACWPNWKQQFMGEAPNRKEN